VLRAEPGGMEIGVWAEESEVEGMVRNMDSLGLYDDDGREIVSKDGDGLLFGGDGANERRKGGYAEVGFESLS